VRAYKDRIAATPSSRLPEFQKLNRQLKLRYGFDLTDKYMDSSRIAVLHPRTCARTHARSLARTYTHVTHPVSGKDTRARAHTHTRTHTHTHIVCLCACVCARGRVSYHYTLNLDR